MSMILTIRHLGGSLAGKSQRIALQQGQTVKLGRAPENDIKFSDAVDDSVSGLHAELSLTSGRLLVEDKRSSNGTFVNGAPCPAFQKLAVPDGSRLRLGKEGPEMQVVLEGAPSLAKPGTKATGATGATGATQVPAKEAVGRVTLLREIDRARQDERDVMVDELAKTGKKSNVRLIAGLAAVLVLAVSGIAGTSWMSQKKAKAREGVLQRQLQAQKDEMARAQTVWADVEQKVSPTVPHIRCQYSLRIADYGVVPQQGVEGSGVQIRPGLILTALHVVEPWKFSIKGWDENIARSVIGEYDLLDVQFPGKQPIKATLVAGSAEHDLALLQVQETMAPVVTLGTANTDVKVTDEIAVFGYPGELGQYVVAVNNMSGIGTRIASLTEVTPSFIKGTVAQPLTDTGDTAHRMFFDASIEPGNSGGPVVNRNGALIGIVSLRFQRKGAVSILGREYPTMVPMAAGSVAVTPDDISSFLRKHGIV